jgi:uncharacterized protein (TIGR03086 family)
MIFAVLDDLDRLSATFTTEQDGLPTPCPELDVRALRRHLLGWLDYFGVAFQDPAGNERPDPLAYTGPDELGAGIGKLAATLRCALDEGVATVVVNVPQLGGAYPGSVVVDLLLIEVLGHGWDLARAVGQPWKPDPVTSEHALGVLHAIMQPEFRQPGMPFGPEVTVAENASALDRFVAFTGRDPGWAPPAP